MLISAGLSINQTAHIYCQCTGRGDRLLSDVPPALCRAPSPAPNCPSQGWLVKCLLWAELLSSKDEAEGLKALQKEGS